MDASYSEKFKSLVSEDGIFFVGDLDRLDASRTFVLGLFIVCDLFKLRPRIFLLPPPQLVLYIISSARKSDRRRKRHHVIFYGKVT